MARKDSTGTDVLRVLLASAERILQADVLIRAKGRLVKAEVPEPVSLDGSVRVDDELLRKPSCYSFIRRVLCESDWTVFLLAMTTGFYGDVTHSDGPQFEWPGIVNACDTVIKASRRSPTPGGFFAHPPTLFSKQSRTNSLLTTKTCTRLEHNTRSTQAHHAFQTRCRHCSLWSYYCLRKVCLNTAQWPGRRLVGLPPRSSGTQRIPMPTFRFAKSTSCSEGRTHATGNANASGSAPALADSMPQVGLFQLELGNRQILRVIRLSLSRTRFRRKCTGIPQSSA